MGTSEHLFHRQVFGPYCAQWAIFRKLMLPVRGRQFSGPIRSRILCAAAGNRATVQSGDRFGLSVGRQFTSTATLPPDP